MKIAVIKLGARISFNANDTSGGNGEARSIVNILHTGGAEVHIFTKLLKKDDLLEQFKWHNMSDAADDVVTAANECDALLVINGNVNFFGGAEDPEQILNYVVINKFKGPVFYAFCDPELTLKQLWPAVAGKPWASNWKQEDVEITRSDIIYLSQPFDTEKVAREFGRNEVKPALLKHFPFEQFPCLNPKLELFETPEVDLSYGGTMRGGRRVLKMTKFYWGLPDDISVEMFGKIDHDDFTKLATGKRSAMITGLRPPVFTGPVKYADMLPKMNKALSHLVIGDPWYEEINDIPQRLYESIWSSVVTFIDADMDTNRRVYGTNPELADFLYVSGRDEFVDKLRLLKAESGLREQIIAEQFQTINFDANVYSKRLTTLMKELSA